MPLPERYDPMLDDIKFHDGRARFYKLVDRIPVPCALREWATLFQSQQRVSHDEVTRPDSDPVSVSTVFLGMDHRHFGEGPPILFETMVFGGPLDMQQVRYDLRCSDPRPRRTAGRGEDRGRADGRTGQGLHCRDPYQGALMTDHTRRFVLLQRLADRPVEQWHLDDEAAMTILGALGAAPSAPEEIMNAMAQLVDQMKSSQRALDHEARRLRNWGRVSFWLGLILSAMFAASYLASGRLVELFCSIAWGVGTLGHAFLPRRSTTP